jgi:NHL repeat
MGAGRIGWIGGLGALAALAAVFALAPSASADLAFCAPGEGAGQCSGAGGVAVDFESGRLYVADTGNNRVDVFEANGDFIFAFGWEVNAEAPEAKLQVCTEATGCRKGSAGAGTGQFNQPQRVAVDNDPASLSRHDVYVGTGNFRVQKFGSDGSFELGFGWGVRDGSEAAQTCGPEASPPSAVCLTGLKGSGLCQFQESNANQNPVAIGPAGVISVANPTKLVQSEGYEPRIERFTSGGECIEAVPIAGTGGESKFDNPTSLAVDGTGDSYVHFRAAGIHKYHPDGSSYGAPYPLDEDEFATALAVDAAGNLYAKENEAVPSPWSEMVTEHDSAGAYLRRWGYGTVPNSFVGGIAPFHSGAGDVFLSVQNAGVLYLAFPAPGPQVPPASVQAPVATVGNTKATLGAEVNPEGKASGYRFDYVREALCEEDEAEGGECFEEAQHREGAIGPVDFKLHKASAQAGCADPVNEASEAGKCLVPETRYRFRLTATNTDGNGNTPIEEVEGQPLSFETKPAIEFGDVWSTGVGIETATLRAEANPLGIPTTAYFQYVSEETCEEDEAEGGECFEAATEIPDVAHGANPIDLGAGEAFAEPSASPSGLDPATAYRFRLVASDALIAPKEVAGPEGSFTTFAAPGAPPSCAANAAFRTGPSAALPDCRAYEMVSPIDKEGGDIVVLRQRLTLLPAVLEQSATSGAKLAYGSSRAFGDAPSGPYTSQYIATRHAGEGWTNHGISPPRENLVVPLSASADSELKTLSPDLCESWLVTVSEPKLTPDAVKGFPNLYRDDLCGAEGFKALTTVEPPTVDPVTYDKLELQGRSADGTKGVFLAPDKLTGEASPGQQQLYEHSPAGLHLVCILPNGTPTAPCTGGGAGEGNGLMRTALVQGAMSDSGQRVFWSAASTSTGPLYMRQSPEQGIVPGEECTAGKPCTVPVSGEGEVATGSGTARFWCAAADGSTAIYAVGADLYRVEITEEAGHPVSHSTLVAHKFKGLAGCSEDASHLYLVSEEELTGPNAEGKSPAADQPNLYLYDASKPEGERFAFVAALAGADSYVTNPRAELRTSRVAPDGESAAFMSAGSLTGYDNLDAASKQADAEVYLYDAREERLRCASCNPSGERPEGRLGTIQKNELAGVWMAARLPVPQNTLYASRALAEDGKRLFFNSYDPLAPTDSNGAEDLYQWEAAGEGGCAKGSPSFSAANGGCVDLISSGQSAQDSEFVDADPSGQNAFFTTLSSLVDQDPGLIDVYDARVNGGLPGLSTPSGECEGAACQGFHPAPEDATPASAAPAGDGNLQEAAKGPGRHPCPKGKRKVRRHGKARCVKKHHKKSHGHKHRRGHGKRSAR